MKHWNLEAPQRSRKVLSDPIINRLYTVKRMDTQNTWRMISVLSSEFKRNSISVWAEQLSVARGTSFLVPGIYFFLTSSQTPTHPHIFFYHQNRLAYVFNQQTFQYIFLTTRPPGIFFFNHQTPLLLTNVFVTSSLHPAFFLPEQTLLFVLLFSAAPTTPGYISFTTCPHPHTHIYFTSSKKLAQ